MQRYIQFSLSFARVDKKTVETPEAVNVFILSISLSVISSVSLIATQFEVLGLNRTAVYLVTRIRVKTISVFWWIHHETQWSKQPAGELEKIYSRKFLKLWTDRVRHRQTSGFETIVNHVLNLQPRKTSLPLFTFVTCETGFESAPWSGSEQNKYDFQKLEKLVKYFPLRKGKSVPSRHLLLLSLF